MRPGDIRTALLAVLAEGPGHGYDVIKNLEEKSGGAWKPSPGSVYPTISQLEDEGLVEADEERGRRTLRLSDEGRRYVEEHPDELAAVWRPFGQREESTPLSEFAALKPELGQVAAAVWQIITTGTDQQRRDAIGVLIDTRRQLYGLLAEGDAVEDPDDPEAGDDTDETEGRYGEEDRS
jgi:DNA-binding PadR family transcriptional regulator